MRNLFHILRRVIMLGIVLGVLACVPWVVTQVGSMGDVASDVSELPKAKAGDQRVGLVLGAGLVGEQPSALLDDRLLAARRLMVMGRVDVLLVSGDNQRMQYDEPGAMRRRLVELGVDGDRVAADYGGRRTWDSCVRARKVFAVKDVVVVTSDFHVARAVQACRGAGIKRVRGLSVDSSGYQRRHRAVWRVREIVADVRGTLDAWVLKPRPAVGGPRIDIFDPCALERSLSPEDRSDLYVRRGRACRSSR